jgi:hypothetical protein
VENESVEPSNVDEIQDEVDIVEEECNSQAWR